MYSHTQRRQERRCHRVTTHKTGFRQASRPLPSSWAPGVTPLRPQTARVWQVVVPAMALVLLSCQLPAHSPRDMVAAMKPDVQRSSEGLTSCVSIGGDVTGKWCDMTCSDQPDDPGCSLYCNCPSLEEKASADAKKAEVKAAAGGCKVKVETVSAA
eukprot:scaffold75165_cov63-Phaeocystis_antarctica.AAC.1